MKTEALLALSVDLGSPNNLNLPSIALEKGLGQVLTTTFTVIGALAVVFIIIGAFKYVVSLGDSAGIKSAKNTILYAVIGLVVSLLAFGIVGFITEKVK